jgi:hypothetical protein
MEKEFVSYEIALALKELGFDEPCFMFYEQGTKDKYLQQGVDDDYWGDYSEPRDWNSIPNKPWKPFCQCISAPLYQQAFRWFREKYDLHSYIEGAYPWFRFYINSEDDRCEGYKHLLFEEAELECLKKLIEIVNGNNN